MHSGSKRCPACKLLAPGSAELCDCGFDYRTQMVNPARRMPPRRREPLRTWERLLLFGVGSFVVVVVATFAWFMLTLGAGESVLLSQAPLTIGPEWTTLRPSQPLECSWPRKSIDLAFPRGDSRDKPATADLEDAKPEVVIIDTNGRTYPLASYGHASYGESVSLTFLAIGAPKDFVLRAAKIRASTKVRVPEVLWNCRNDAL